MERVLDPTDLWQVGRSSMLMSTDSSSSIGAGSCSTLPFRSSLTRRPVA